MTILDRLPILGAGWIVPTPDGAKEVKPYQIIVTVSIADECLAVLPDDTPRFPAILDTGNNHNFAIRQGQLERWAPMILPQTGRVVVGGFFAPILGANVWIHLNQPGTSDSSGSPPFCLELARGIMAYPPDVPNPARPPILGLRGLIRKKLRLTIDGAGPVLTLESPSA